jgi:hypothetical protein
MPPAVAKPALCAGCEAGTWSCEAVPACGGAVFVRRSGFELECQLRVVRRLVGAAASRQELAL